MASFRWQRFALPVAIFFFSACIYVLVLGNRRARPAENNHYAHLAESWVHGQLNVLGNKPPNWNDWACYDSVEKRICPSHVPRSGGDESQYKWYVSFPPLPALVLVPAVAIAGTRVWDPLIWAIFAGLTPALLFVLLRFLSETGRSVRSTRDNLLLTALFGFGTAFFYTAVNGDVWFAAHVVACPLMCLYVLWALDARRPLLAGLMLGLMFMSRPTTFLLGAFFMVEAMRVSRLNVASEPSPDALVWTRIVQWLRGVNWLAVVRRAALFAAPILVIGALAMWMNAARFDDPFEFGHRYLQIRWRDRIERWGMFNYHYLAKNLSVFLAGLPWLSANAPYITVNGHGLALWFTTPNLLLTLWPKRGSALITALWMAVVPVMLWNLLYQNTGWLQFAYRFSLDYLVLLFVLLAVGARRFGPGFWLLAIFSIAVNTFGALTFDRMMQYYHVDLSQQTMFQPD